MAGRSRGGRGGGGRGRSSGNKQRDLNSGTMAPLNQQRRMNEVSGQSASHLGPTQESGQSSARPVTIESQSSRIQPLDLSTGTENGGIASSSTRKNRRGKYKSKTVDIKTKCGGKITITIPEDIDRAVGPGARDIVNYCGLIMRTTVSFRDGNWETIVAKHGEAMWLKVKDKFQVSNILREHVLQAFAISTMQRLFRAWKARLSTQYGNYKTDAERLSHRPDDVDLDDWKYLIQHFGSDEFKALSERNKKNRDKQVTRHLCGTKSFAEVEESTRNPETGEKAPPDRVWELQHTRKNDRGEVVWSDPHAQQVHDQLQELVAQQQSEEVENPMSRDEILTSVLGERPGYVRGKGYGKKPPKKRRTQQANIEASVSSAIDIMRQQMQDEMDKKLHEEREQIAANLKKDVEEELQKKLDEELQKKLDEERQHASSEVDKKIQEQMDKLLQEKLAVFMSQMQRGRGF